MNVLLIGSGGREHALGWKLAQTASVVYSLPGNPGLAQVGPRIEGVDPTNGLAIADLAAELDIDLVVVGPEAPLAAGVVDAVTAHGVAAFGPTRAAAQLESSKWFAKQLMGEAGVPTAEARSFTDPDAAKLFLGTRTGPHVVKADGLAAGKGVLVTEDVAEAQAWVDHCIGGGFGVAGNSVVIEDHLDGPELSVFALCDGTDGLLLEPARDYKRLSDGDAGPNTGGMGSYSPVELPAGLLEDVTETVIQPVLRTMADRGTPYRGLLYVGLVLTSDGPRVLEFNCRFGDPETQAIMPRLRSDLGEVMHRAATSSIADLVLEWLPIATVNVVLASPGYPEHPEKGAPIEGLREWDDVFVFHAGTAWKDDSLVTSGGRVLSVVGTGADVARARDRAYGAAGEITWPGRLFRTDIGLDEVE